MSGIRLTQLSSLKLQPLEFANLSGFKICFSIQISEQIFAVIASS